jgi:hypothetical protein
MYKKNTLITYNINKIKIPLDVYSKIVYILLTERLVGK